MAEWFDGTIMANGINVHYLRTGGDKPPLVLSHGFTDNGSCWARVAQSLEADYDVIMPDARGHGLSDATETGYSPEELAADLKAFILALGLVNPGLMGHSMGAGTTAVTAATYPEIARWVILEDPPWTDASLPPAAREALNKVTLDKAMERRQMTREELLNLLRERHPHWAAIELDSWVDSKRQLSPLALQRSSGIGRDWREDARRITCPTLLIAADQERMDPGSDNRPLEGIVNRAVASEAVSLNPRIQVVFIREAGHSIRRDQFKSFMEAIVAFLAET